ncbi:hypothetical protein AAVH_00775 [Aphelenchoides avenae]|nr:hypothetical protein AAVH_00775 [Aphelenchus avenae]
MFRQAVIVLALLCIGASASKLCGSRYENLLNQMCTFAKESRPCLGSTSAQDRVRANCCERGCSAAEIKQACCFTNDCLNRCYPGKGYKLGGVY